MHTPYISIIVPAYNEAARLVSTIQKVERFFKQSSLTYEILLVDDGSTDDTLQIMNELAAHSIFIRVIHYTPNVGKGKAVQQGVKNARGHFVFFIDADGSTPIEVLPTFLKDLQAGADVVIGSRYKVGSTISRAQPIFRKVMGKVAHFFIQIVLLPGFTDTQCGFKGFKHSSSQKLFHTLYAKRWGFDFEILVRARNYRLTITEVPVTWLHEDGSRFRAFKSGITTLFELIKVFFLVRILKR